MSSAYFERYNTATTQAGADGVARFKADALGISVHFGLYSCEGRKEWDQCLEKIPREIYARRRELFNPTAFNADAWVEQFVRWGATAFMVTTKHHDGFCLFESKHTDFTSVHAPCRRDLVAELARACERRGVALHLYHSLIDWHHPLMSSVAFELAEDFPAYCDYMLAQISELLTNYGPVAGMLFDGWWPASRATQDQGAVVAEDRWPLGRIYDTIHRLQPDCMITNNHHVLPLAGEDYQVWEIDLPGGNTTGFNCTEIGDRPLMAWMTATANGWSWQPARTDYRTPEDLVAKFRGARAMGAMFMQNLGPMHDGRLNPIEVELMDAVTARMRRES